MYSSFWLVIVIALALALRHSVEMRFILNSSHERNVGEK